MTTTDTTYSDVYDALAPTYDERYDTPVAHAEDAFVATLLRPLVEGARNVLDVGCGTGLLVDLLGDVLPVERYTGVDPSAGMLDRFVDKHPGAADRLFHGTYGRFHGARVHLPGWLQYDLVVSLFGSAAYLDRYEVEGLFDAVAPGGTLVAMPYAEGYWPRDLHDEPATSESVRVRLLQHRWRADLHRLNNFYVTVLTRPEDD